jgi:hypothetical protein
VAAVAQRQASDRGKVKLPNLRFNHLGVRGNYQNDGDETHSTTFRRPSIQNQFTGTG